MCFSVQHSRSSTNSSQDKLKTCHGGLSSRAACCVPTILSWESRGQKAVKSAWKRTISPEFYPANQHEGEIQTFPTGNTECFRLAWEDTGWWHKTQPGKGNDVGECKNKGLFSSDLKDKCIEAVSCKCVNGCTMSENVTWGWHCVSAGKAATYISSIPYGC